MQHMASEIFKFESVDDDGRRTIGYYKLTLWAFGSGELKSDIYPHWMAAHARLKNEFTEGEKYHNLMT